MASALACLALGLAFALGGRWISDVNGASDKLRIPSFRVNRAIGRLLQRRPGPIYVDAAVVVVYGVSLALAATVALAQELLTGSKGVPLANWTAFGMGFVVAVIIAVDIIGLLRRLAERRR